MEAYFVANVVEEIVVLAEVVAVGVVVVVVDVVVVLVVVGVVAVEQIELTCVWPPRLGSEI